MAAFLIKNTNQQSQIQIKTESELRYNFFPKRNTTNNNDVKNFKFENRQDLTRLRFDHWFRSTAHHPTS